MLTPKSCTYPPCPAEVSGTVRSTSSCPPFSTEEFAERNGRLLTLESSEDMEVSGMDVVERVCSPSVRDDCLTVPIELVVVVVVAVVRGPAVSWWGFLSEVGGAGEAWADTFPVVDLGGGGVSSNAVAFPPPPPLSERAVWALEEELDVTGVAFFTFSSKRFVCRRNSSSS